MKNFFSSLCLTVCVLVYGIAQPPRQPKLIVGIAVDQMRYDYLYKYYSKLSETGFKKFLSEGFSCENTHYNYFPTYTAPGHAAIYTGTTPAVHGIAGNEWWDRKNKRQHYVTSDERFKTVGSANAAVGQHSPSVLLTSTITDELKLSNNFKSKVVGICIKDRGSILPAGHIPDAAYWFDDRSGNWVTSSYYPDSLGLPQWVTRFNEAEHVEKYLEKDWTTLLPVSSYTESFGDWDRYEQPFRGVTGSAFPHKLPELRKTNGLGVIRSTPFGNSLTLDFALAAIDHMNLGKDEFPDFLCLSFSSTDYIGHQFGVHSQEVEDTYLRLDADLSRLLAYLERNIGKDNVLIFLSADHGGGESPGHLKEIGMQAGFGNEEQMAPILNTLLQNQFGRGSYVDFVINQQVYFSDSVLNLPTEKLKLIKKESQAIISRQPGVYKVYSMDELPFLNADNPFVSQLILGMAPVRSGDMVYLTTPAWFPDQYYKKGGTTHGSPYPYDTHVPLLWYGWKVPQGETQTPVSITDIAPTLAAMLKIMEPNGSTGKVIQDLFPGK